MKSVSNLGDLLSDQSPTKQAVSSNTVDKAIKAVDNKTTVPKAEIPKQKAVKMTATKVAQALALYSKQIISMCKNKVAALEEELDLVKRENEKLARQIGYEEKLATYCDHLIEIGALDDMDREDFMKEARLKAATSEELPDPEILMTEAGKMMAIKIGSSAVSRNNVEIEGLDKVANFKEGSASREALNNFLGYLKKDSY